MKIHTKREPKRNLIKLFFSFNFLLFFWKQRSSSERVKTALVNVILVFVDVVVIVIIIVFGVMFTVSVAEAADDACLSSTGEKKKRWQGQSPAARDRCKSSTGLGGHRHTETEPLPLPLLASAPRDAFAMSSSKQQYNNYKNNIKAES